MFPHLSIDRHAARGEDRGHGRVGLAAAMDLAQVWKGGMFESSGPSGGHHESSAGEPVRAAQYVRMSTEHQQYSTENQAEVIRAYAGLHGIEIVRSYEDAGKSGLRLDGRNALQRLIDDVQTGTADFTTILVFDVSRWGRFQDADESAYYEYLCRRAGISVQYCAEQFDNDGSPISTIVKGVKRAMAGEYSRELSAKVFAGQCRLIELGFRQGGGAGYGLRRRLIDQGGHPKGELAAGEQKSVQTDRIILVPGPEEEVETVRWIYRAFVEDGLREPAIAAALNARGIPSDLGRPWTRAAVQQILINEKYIGNNVWNRVSFKLKKKRVRNPPEMWIRSSGVFEAIIDAGLFEAARVLIQERSRRHSDQEMLDLLRALFQAHGRLSGMIIDESEGVPSSRAYRARFGSLLRAYELVGFRPDRDYRYLEVNKTLRRLHPEVVSTVIAGIERAGGHVAQDSATDLLTINDEFTASIVVARCQETSSGSRRWLIRMDTSLGPDLTVAIRMDSANRGTLDYFLLPSVDMTVTRVRLAEQNGVSLDAYRFESLEPLYALSARVPLLEVA
jgi:DNA invertase Pin-like site-specific DNA recombinase